MGQVVSFDSVQRWRNGRMIPPKAVDVEVMGRLDYWMQCRLAANNYLPRN